MNNENNLIVVLISLIALLFVFSVIFQPQPVPGQPAGGNTVSDFKEIPRFEDYSKLLEAIKTSMNNRSYGVLEGIGGIMPTLSNSATSVTKAVSESDSGSTNYSKTNVQVEGVDEADIVKTDGKYIYNFSQNNLIITDAYPIENAKIVSKTVLKDISPQEMFVSENKLLVFGSRTEYSNNEGISKIAMPRYYYNYNPETVAILYDISNKENPVVEKEIVFSGNYITSRLIGKNAYFIVNSYPSYYTLENSTEDENSVIPLMQIDGKEMPVARAADIGYMPVGPKNSFVTIASLNLDSKELQKETILGDAENVFASTNNIYLASTVYDEIDTVPVVKEAARIIIGDIENTVINKFGLVDGKIGFIGQGKVFGHVLNQFSMDEFEGNFRIATTMGQVLRGGSSTSNNLYVLDQNMKTIGTLEGLAPGEKIYSARFMGNRAYMVTFKKVDPLFVIDVSNPKNPTVLGKLKIPGYSDYLHPIDENHIIGLGKDTIESTYGDFAWYQGIKLAVFDVSDVSAPKEMHKIVIGDRGTDSYALYDHKAFLYDKEKQLLVLPILLAEIPAEQKKPLENNMQSPSYGEQVFQGAFVFKLTLENGFEERGRITHVTPEEELKRGYYYGEEYSVKRALFIENVLYTLSEKMLKANSLDSLKELKDFVFEEKGNPAPLTEE